MAAVSLLIENHLSCLIIINNWVLHEQAGAGVEGLGHFAQACIECGSITLILGALGFLF